jgi:hypothetical protein
MLDVCYKIAMKLKIPQLKLTPNINAPNLDCVIQFAHNKKLQEKSMFAIRNVYEGYNIGMSPKV